MEGIIKRMKKTALIIMALAVISKIFGLGRDVVLSYFYGTSNISDAYLISDTIPSVIFGFITAGLIAGFIPMYTHIEKNDGKEEADKFTNNTMNLLMTLCTIIIFITLPFTDQLVKVFASGFNAETLELTASLTRITMLSIYFTGMVTILSGYLQIKNNFVIPVLIGIPLDIIIIASIIISHKTNTTVLAIGYVLAVASQVFLMVPFIRKNHYHFKPRFVIKDRHLIKMGYIALPVILGTSIDKINMLVERSVASGVIEGGISALSYASRFNAFVQAIFVWSITATMYPTTSKMAAENNMTGLKNTISESIVGISLFVMPITAGFMVLSKPVVSILFGRGAFDDNAIMITSQALFFYSIGMIGFGIRDIMTRAFYSLQNTKMPMIISTIGVLLNIALNFILSKFMGIGGLALATAIAATLTSMVLFVSLRKKIGPFGIKQTAWSFIKILTASLIMCVVAKYCFDSISIKLNPNVSLIIAIAIAAILYFTIIYFMKIKDVDLIINLIKNKFRKKEEPV